MAAVQVDARSQQVAEPMLMLGQFAARLAAATVEGAAAQARISAPDAAAISPCPPSPPDPCALLQCVTSSASTFRRSLPTP